MLISHSGLTTCKLLQCYFALKGGLGLVLGGCKIKANQISNHFIELKV